jgi:hypothetical protein
MKANAVVRCSFALLSCLVFLQTAAAAADREGVLLDGTEWQALTWITGFHSLQKRKAGLDVRLFEADGSATVAQNPIGLFLAVTGGETPHIVDHIWRLPRGVARVKSFVDASCGADVRVEVDRITADSRIDGTVAKTLRLCFLGPDGKLSAHLKVSETSR